MLFERRFNGSTYCGTEAVENYNNIKVCLLWPELTEENPEPSLLEKHLSYNLFKKFEDKSDKANVSFKQMIFAGVKENDKN